MSNFDKHMQICGAAFIPVDDAVISCNHASAGAAIRVMRNWTVLPVTKAEFSEEEGDRGLITQKFEATMTEAKNDRLNNLLGVLNAYGLLRIDYTNGERRVVGDDQRPVMLSVSKEGDPLIVKLSLKRVSCSRARLLASL